MLVLLSLPVSSILCQCVAGEQQAEYDVSFLPPLVLNFELPSDYPTTSSPVFTLSSKWLTRTQVRPSLLPYQQVPLPLDTALVSYLLIASASVVKLKSYGHV